MREEEKTPLKNGQTSWYSSTIYEVQDSNHAVDAPLVMASFAGPVLRLTILIRAILSVVHRQ